jgi:hypothetical protein
MSPSFATLTTISEPSFTLRVGPGIEPLKGQHPDGGVAEPLCHGRDAQVELVAVGQVHYLGLAGLGETRDLC